MYTSWQRSRSERVSAERANGAKQRRRGYLLPIPVPRRWRSLDAQPQGASPAYANYAYGVYMSAAGYTVNQALSGADIYAEYRAHYPVTVPMARPEQAQTNVEALL